MKPMPRIALVVLSNGDRHVYSGLKHLCDVCLDVATVCVHVAKIRKDKGQMQYFSNVALGAVNRELGQENIARCERARPGLSASTDLFRLDYACQA